MFTGIIKGVGHILEQTEVGGDRRLAIGIAGVALPALNLGDSVAVNGACLTVVESDAAHFVADVSMETLSVTTLGGLSVGAAVNLEPALRLGDPLGGHWVTGHVDGVGRVSSVRGEGRSQRVTIEAPQALAPYIASKGAVAVDGVSLTVNAVTNGAFEVNIVPHTWKMTVIAGYKAGTAVNIEVDIVARYLERLTLGSKEATGVSWELLQSHGYARRD